MQIPQLRQEAFANSPFPVRVLSETDSTNDALKRLPDAPHGTVLVSGRQTAGRGRQGRPFVSPEGGVYLSVLLRPAVPAAELLHLTPMAAVAVRRAIFDACGVAAEIKWPNDLVFAGRKLVGILTELIHRGGADCVIVGAGVNCNAGLADFPPEVQKIATSLREITGKTVDPNVLARNMVKRFAEMDAALLTEKKAWLAEFAAACVTVGKRVQLISGAERKEGFAEGIDENGALIVRFDTGKTAAVSTGEVSVRGMYGYI